VRAPRNPPAFDYLQTYIYRRLSQDGMQTSSKVPSLVRLDDPLSELSSAMYLKVPHMAPLLLTQKSPSSEIPNIPTIERRITQLRGNSVNGFRVSSTRIDRGYRECAVSQAFSIPVNAANSCESQ